MTTFVAPQPKPITWRGVTALYTVAEGRIMAEVGNASQDDAHILHLLKAEFPGSVLRDGDR